MLSTLGSPVYVALSVLALLVSAVLWARRSRREAQLALVFVARPASCNVDASSSRRSTRA